MCTVCDVGGVVYLMRDGLGVRILGEVRVRVRVRVCVCV
jgi:hypothetical protein